MRFFYFYKMLIEDLYKLFKQNPVICTDSRNILPGCMFFALKGNNFNGNCYAEEALNKGASYSIIDEQEFKKNNNYVLVDNVLVTLQKLANYHRKQLNIPIIAITGTNGKTTTKELITAVLSKKYKVTATAGNLNNHIGVPVTLLSMNESSEIGVVEMGANHLNEINELCTIAEPGFGLITNIGKAHLEGFGSFRGVIKAKTELYKYLDKSNGEIFYNAENPVLIKPLNKLTCQKIAYGVSIRSLFSTRSVLSDPYLNFEMVLNEQSNTSGNIFVQTQLIGFYNLENVLAAIRIGIYFNVPTKEIISAIKEYIPTNFRSQFKEAGSNQLLLDFYNANPSSMEVAIDNFKNISVGNRKKVIVLGEMLELGVESKKEHLKLLQLLESSGFKDVFLVGKGFRSIDPIHFKYFDNSDLLKEYLDSYKIENSFILIKGSRGVKLEKILDCFKTLTKS
jgi:UDP-N-acetylmuramoyl-tripeptide--D-alanyl-D-alanine ligase